MVDTKDAHVCVCITLRFGLHHQIVLNTNKCLVSTVRSLKPSVGFLQRGDTGVTCRLSLMNFLVLLSGILSSFCLLSALLMLEIKLCAVGDQNN